MKIDPKLKRLILFALLFCFGASLRILFLPAKTLDMDSYLLWYDYIVQHGILRSIGSDYFGYNPPFIYLLALTTLTRSFLHPIIAIKLIPILFDIVNAVLVYKIVRVFEPQSDKPTLAALLFWVAPTIMINSAFWGQTDALYVCFLLLTVLLLLRERPVFALIAFSAAFAVKAQAVFLAPFLAVLFFKKRIPLRAFFVFPFVYLLSFLPAALAGRPIASLFSTYSGQVGTFELASKNAANPYLFVNESDYLAAVSIGIPLAATLLLAWALFYGFKKYNLSSAKILWIALVSLALVPYLLPKMHDRYFYPADVFSILAAFAFPNIWFVPIAYQIISFLSYLPYLFDAPKEILLPVALALNTSIIIFLLWKQWKLSRNETSSL
ncbi:MAG: hypothetical protein LC099_11885 [Anaerolineales bacterium]|nr:hypothetical protein [Anaerolineales bacterium]